MKFACHNKSSVVTWSEFTVDIKSHTLHRNINAVCEMFKSRESKNCPSLVTKSDVLGF